MARICLLLLCCLGLWAPAARAIEEPVYQVVERTPVFEVRHYPGYVVAEVTVSGSADDAGNAGFRILAGYIFGKNRRRNANGDPAAASGTPPRDAPSERLAMTAPVNLIPVGADYRVEFVMPAGSTLATLPEPLDPRIRLRESGPQDVAVIRYSGRWTEANYREHLETLRQALAAAGRATTGEPVLARYDPPFMPFFFRRNEIWLTLQ